MNSSCVNATILPFIGNISTALMNATSNATFPSSTTALGVMPHSPTINEFKVYNRVIYIVLLVTGLIGNFLTCFVILTRSDMNRSIHIYTFNLATTDLILLVVYLPSQMLINEKDLIWPLGDGLCRVQYSIVSVTIFSTIGTLIAITMDRHRGVTRPFSWRENSRAVARLALPAIWIIAVILSVPLIVVVKTKEDPPGSGLYYCVETWQAKAYSSYWIAMFCLQFLLPLLVIIIAHIHIMYRISRDIDQVSNKHNKRMIRMIVVLTLVYTICTVPQHIVFFWSEFGDLIHLKAGKSIFLIANSLILLQACVNPVIYGTLRQDFKRSFASLLLCMRFHNFLYRRFGVGTAECANSANDVTQLQMVKAKDRFATGIQQGLKKAIRVRKRSDTPPLGRLLESSADPPEHKKPFKIQIESNSSSDSGISNTMSGQNHKKSVTFLLVPNENEDGTHSTYVGDGHLLHPQFFDKSRSGSSYDVLENSTDSLGDYDLNNLWNADMKETDI